MPPTLVRVPGQRPLAPSGYVASVANHKNDNEMIPGLCTDLLAFALQLRKTPENLSYETVNEGYVTSHRINGLPYLQIRSVGSHSMPGREKEGKKKTGREGIKRTV